jgi:hypothetical protein
MDSSEDFDRWTRLKALVESEWGTAANGGGARFTLTARAAANDVDDPLAMAKMRQVIFAQREIHNLISQVEQAARGDAKAKEEMAVPVLADYSRRGGL